MSDYITKMLENDRRCVLSLRDTHEKERADAMLIVNYSDGEIERCNDKLRQLDEAIQARAPAAPHPSPDVQQEDRQQEAQAIPEGFVAWKSDWAPGRDLRPPVSPTQSVEVIYRDGTRETALAVVFDWLSVADLEAAGDIEKGECEDDADIIAYRLLPPEETAKDGETVSGIEASEAGVEYRSEEFYSIRDKLVSSLPDDPANNQQEDSLKGEGDEAQSFLLRRGTVAPYCGSCLTTFVNGVCPVCDETPRQPAPNSSGDLETAAPGGEQLQILSPRLEQSEAAIMLRQDDIDASEPELKAAPLGTMEDA